MPDFACPRCRCSVSEEFYGPCGVCREELRRVMAVDARTIEVAAYEPKMSVVANNIAAPTSDA